MLRFNKCPALHGSRLPQPKSLSLDMMYDHRQKVMLDFRANSHAHTNATRLFMTDVQLTNHTDALVVDGLVMCLTADFSMTNDSTILPRRTIKLDRLIVLSKSSLLGWFLHVSLIRDNQGEETV